MPETGVTDPDDPQFWLEWTDDERGPISQGPFWDITEANERAEMMARATGCDVKVTRD